jgi:GH35 family endo-1,4-beta-xylanase
MGLKEENVAITEEVKVINGEEYRFLVVSVEQSTLTDEQNKYSHLYQSKPLFLSIKSADKELKYKTIGLDSLGRLLNKRLATTGTYWDSSSPYEEVVLQNFDAIVTENDLNWKKIEPTKGTYKSSRVNHTNKLTEIDKKAFSVVGNSLVDSIPDWVLSNSPEVTRQNIRDHIKEMFEMFPEINEWVVMKEFGWDNDPLIGQLGSKYYLEVYQMARDVAKELGRESEIKLLYGDNNNHTVDSPAYSNTIKIVNALKEKNLIDGVTLHLHVWGDKNLDSASIENAVDSYGLPTYFQEIDINMKRVPVSRTDRLLQQADIEFEIVTAGANSENVVLIGHWLIGDNKSWYEIEGASPSDRYSKDADPTLFYDDLSPKPAYYAAIQALWNALSTQY